MKQWNLLDKTEQGEMITAYQNDLRAKDTLQMNCILNEARGYFTPTEIK